jgi:hypothetical protein
MSEGGQEDDASEAREVDRDQFVGEPPAGDARRDEFMSDDQSARRPDRPGRKDHQPSGAGREDQTDEQSEDDQ